MLPDFGGIIWFIAWMLTTIIASCLFLLFYFWVMPKLARDAIKAKWSGGVVAFIQDDTGKVHMCASKKEYPEGVAYFKGRGWFMLPRRPYENIEMGMEEEDPEKVQFRESFIKALMKNNKELSREDAIRKYVDAGLTTDLSEDKRREYKETIEKLIHAPILDGLGKQVFFGSSDSVALSSLKNIADVTGATEVVTAKVNGENIGVTTNFVAQIKTLAYANLRNSRLLAPLMYSKTQLDALATGNRIEGAKMFGRDTVKLLVVAIAAACVIGSLGIVAYMLTQGNG